MPSGNWKRYAAIGLAAFAAAILVSTGFWGVEKYRTGHADQRERVAQNEAAARLELWPSRCLRIPVPEGAVCSIDPRFVAPDSERANYDLQAQQGMAEWALAMVLVSIAMWIVTGAGVVYVALTLALTKNVARQQLRAYVFIDNAELSPLAVDETIKAKITYANGGQTPAYKVIAMHVIDVRSMPLTVNLSSRAEVKKRRPYTMMGPRGSRTIFAESTNTATAEEIEMIKSGEAVIFVHGCISYVDVFDQEQFTNFRVVHKAEKTYRPTALWAAEDGNDAS